MRQVSDNYKNLIQSSFRPKINVVIQTSFIGNAGYMEWASWTEQDIISFSYSRSIDPLGRELPYMELVWKERYTGKLDAEGMPEKCQGLTEHQPISLYLTQNMKSLSTWRGVYNSSATWKDLFDRHTWKTLLNSQQYEQHQNKETFTFPTLYLTAKPTISGDVITYRARDLIYFLQEEHLKSFVVGINFVNPLRYFLQNEFGNFKKSEALAEAINSFDKNLKSFGESFGETIPTRVIFEGNTKSIILNHLQTRNLYLDFWGGISPRKLCDAVDTGMMFTNKTAYKPPEIQKSPSVSSYSFKTYTAVENADKIYTKSPTSSYNISGKTIYKTVFDGYGRLQNVNIPSDINYCIQNTNSNVDIIPISWNGVEDIVVANTTGETYAEDNPLNIYGVGSPQIQERYAYLCDYFNNSTVITVNSLSNLAIDTGDIVYVETNLHEGDKRLVKRGVVVGIELEYNGALKQKTIIHELGGVA